jgi:tetratricopeptide (TPR) repeat protein
VRALALGVGLCLSSSSSVALADPLDKPTLTADPKELLAAAQPFRGDTPVVVLRDEQFSTIDDQGRVENRYRVVFVVNTQSAIDGWGTLSLGWSPFYQDKPTVRARVVLPSGQVANLDPSLATDAPAVSESPSVFSDSRKLEVPLPRLVIGAVVEEEMIVKDREALLPAGTAQFAIAGRQSTPVERSLLVVQAPASRKVKVLARGFTKAPAPRHVTAKGVETWTYDIGHMAPLGAPESGTPSDVLQSPYVGFATAPSWAAVAKDYARIVDKRIAEGPFALPAGLTGATEQQTIARIVAWLHEHVRYTGIELADAAIVPWPPAEVAKRGFGDCKDKSTLLVALLRAAGIEADLVLLSTGPGWDVDRELPGMGVFDHAIVRARSGGKDVWIDATDDLMPAGQLPATDQDRLVLVASSKTTDLIRTPAASPEDNLVREVRTYHLAEAERAAVQEVTTTGGAFTSEDRAAVRDGKHDDLMKGYGDYSDRTYHGTFTKYSNTDPSDLATPFVLTLDISQVKRAYTDRDQIDVYLFAADALAKIPSIFSDEDFESDVKSRRLDYAWLRPHVYEIENHLVLPDGFSPPPLIARHEQKLGTMTLTTTRVAGKGEVVVTYRLHTGKARITSAELASTRAAVMQLKNATGEHVGIELTSAALANAGKLVEAAAESRRLIALHPKEALHHEQLAEVYRAAGLGEAARREARAAVAIEPGSASAHSLLGYELSQDTLGRAPWVDVDRKGAIEAYRKALALNPKHAGALSSLAGVLRADDTGFATHDRRALAEAVALLRRAKEAYSTTEYDDRIIADLLLAGNGSDAEDFGKDLPQSDTRDMRLVAAAALAHSASDAVATAQSLVPDAKRVQLIYGAAGILMLIRRYDVMRALFTAAQGMALDPTTIDIMNRVGTVDMTKIDPADPTTPVRLGLAVLGGTKAKVARPWDKELDKTLTAATGVVRRNRALTDWRDFPQDVFDDVMQAYAVMHADGDAKLGWRVEATLNKATFLYYVASDRGKARLLGAPEYPDGVGRYIRELLARKELDLARQWLARLKSDQARSGRLSKLFAALGEPLQLSKDELELAAALLGADDQPGLALPVLQRCAAPSPEAKALCLHVLANVAAAVNNWSVRENADRELVTLEPKVGWVNDLAFSLAHEKRGAEAVKLVDEALAKQPDDPDLLMTRIMLAQNLGEPWSDTSAFADRLAASSSVSVGPLNNVAWLRLFRDATPARARELGTRIQGMSRNLAPNVINTLAAIAAESDQPAQAWKLEHDVITRNGNKVDGADWYVIGRIAETMGLPDDARAAYSRVTKPSVAMQFSPGAYDFVQKRLAAMKSAAH